MDYEEKYEMALERARKYKEKGYMMINAALDNIFPELQESEDERIRKGIIRNLKYLMDKSKGFVKDELSERIAWLEKQGEQYIACSEEQMKVLDEVLNFAANHESSYWNYYIFETLNNFIRQLKTKNIKL